MRWDKSYYVADLISADCKALPISFFLPQVPINDSSVQDMLRECASHKTIGTDLSIQFYQTINYRLFNIKSLN